jgi:hypothetical protein
LEPSRPYAGILGDRLFSLDNYISNDNDNDNENVADLAGLYYPPSFAHRMNVRYNF